MNNKTILFAAGAVLLAASAFTFASVNKSNDPMDDLFEANVEALARNEIGKECGFAAYEYDDDWYEDTKNFRRCGDCEWVRGTNPVYTNC